MAERAVEIALRVLIPAAVLAVTGIIGASLWALLAQGGLSIGSRDLAVLGFTLGQAALSAVLSVLLAIPLGRALWRRSFPGRDLLVRLLTLPFLLPVIVVVVALIEFWGRAGPLNGLLAALGLPPFSLFGLQGILIAHVFFNLPLALRMLLDGWSRVPAEHVRLTASLGLSPWRRFRTLEGPMLRQVAPQALAAVFLICLTSFVIILTLGGGPKNTTLELGIYQALRFDFEPGRAALLALLQLCVGILAALLALAFGTPTVAAGLDRAPVRFAEGRLADTLCIGVALIFLIGPLVLLAPGLLAIPDLPHSTFAAIGRAVAIALGATAITVLLAVPLAISIVSRTRLARPLEAIGLAPLAVSPLVLGTGLFLTLRPFVAVTSWALTLAAMITGIMLIPYFLRLVIPSLSDSQRRFARLSGTLRMRRGTFVIRVLLARSRREIAQAAGLSAALATGEMSVLALLAPPDRPSLPILVNQLIGAYRTDQALAAALVLVALSVGLYTVIAALGRSRHA